nr:sulfurtransferase [Propionibacterium sp.]
MTDAQAVRYFQDKLAYTTSPREVMNAIQAGESRVLVDVRSPEAFERGRVPGALHFTLAQLANASARLPANADVVVYDWGPASTESTRAALSLAAQGFKVQVMIGGFEYWQRLGFGVETPTGVRHRAPDPMTTAHQQPRSF